MAMEPSTGAARRIPRLGLLFWNNPLVVSALRLKLRRGGTMAFISIYALFLGTAAALLGYYQAVLPMQWHVIFLAGMFAIQAGMSALLAMMAVQNSMQMEVANRTWDFQRITGLTPTQLLLGKVLGEGANAYLSIPVTLPFAVWAWSYGAATALEIALLYLNVLTTTTLFATWGLVHPLELPPGKDASAASFNRNKSSGPFIFGFILLIQLLVNSRAMAGNPWLAPFIGLLLPVLPIFGLFEGNVWGYTWRLPGIQIPYLVIAPATQLLFAAWLFQIMRRRVVFLHCTTISKLSALGALFALDLVVLGTLWGEQIAQTEPSLAIASFWSVHAVGGLILLMLCTPSRATLFAWLWHYRDKPSGPADYILGDRTENSGPMFMLWLLGLLLSFGSLSVPGWLAARMAASLPPQFNSVPAAAPLPPDQESAPHAVDGWQAAWESMEAVIPQGVLVPLAALAVLAWGGTVYQFLTLLSGRGGRWLFTAMVCLVTVPPQIGGYIYMDELPSLGRVLLTISPSAQFSHFLGLQPASALGVEPSAAAFILLYGSSALLAFLMLRRQLNYYYRTVQHKLDGMGAAPAARDSHPAQAETMQGALG